jgi:hypothetical protein
MSIRRSATVPFRRTRRHLVERGHGRRSRPDRPGRGGSTSPTSALLPGGDTENLYPMLAQSICRRCCSASWSPRSSRRSCRPRTRSCSSRRRRWCATSTRRSCSAASVEVRTAPRVQPRLVVAVWWAWRRARGDARGGTRLLAGALRVGRARRGLRAAAILSLFWRGTTRAGVFAGLVTGTVTTIVWYFTPALKTRLYELIPAFLLALLVTAVVSRVTRRPQDADAMFAAMTAGGPGTSCQKRPIPTARPPSP